MIRSCLAENLIQQTRLRKAARVCVIALAALVAQACSYGAWFAVANATEIQVIVSFSFTDYDHGCPLIGRAHNQPRAIQIKDLTAKTAVADSWKEVGWKTFDTSACEASFTVDPGQIVAFLEVINYAIGRRSVAKYEFPDHLAISSPIGKITHTGRAFHWGFVEAADSRGSLYVLPFTATGMEARDTLGE